MTSLDRLIEEVEKGHYFDRIEDPERLITNLRKLRDIIGMKNLKESMVEQLNYLLSVPKGTPIKKMLNVVIHGPPGTGKSTIAVIYANILYSIGVLNPDVPIQVENKTYNKISSALTVDRILSYGSFILYALFTVYFFLYKKYGVKYLLIGTLSTIAVLGFLYMVFFSSSKTIPQAGIRHRPRRNLTDDDLVKIVGREHLVGEYVGHTGPKTKKLLEECRGKVLFVDEAYSLYNSYGASAGGDTFGMDALTALTLDMSTNPNSPIIIFAGYLPLLKKGPFKAQEGLARRFMWYFECSPYSAKELYDIFNLQLHQEGLFLDDPMKEVLNLFESNLRMFPNYGGDTERLVFQTQISLCSDRTATSKKMVEAKHVVQGLEKLRKHTLEAEKDIDYNSLVHKLVSEKFGAKQESYI